MITHCFQFDDALRLETCDPEMAVMAVKEREKKIWLDLQDFNLAELEEWLDKMGITGLVRRLCLEARDRSGVYPLKNDLLIVVPLLEDTEPDCRVDYLAIFCRENLLITISSKSILTPKRLAELDESEEWLIQPSITGLVSAIVLDLSIDCMEKNVALRKSILALEDHMDASGTVEANEIIDVQKYLLKLGMVVSGQLHSVKALSLSDKPFFKYEDLKEYLNCALVNLQTSDRSLDWMDERIGALRSGLQMQGQDKTNRRLNLLTILAAIFNPITLLAGIWGMNFEIMPELKFTFGYPFAIGSMFLIASGMFIYFRKNGWFE
jgi:magnesium transporter